ncbi:hypothetical protein MINS_27450 [Mycolicibacterium insubricum]|uniref:Uncharacterized protein n=1 Tax=Mycolicibacterium insubricum TaxID=444597 RepID=A0A1X0D5P3_9MYCO|nr:hypothetical protein [Mycolicibacterium insubricum]MCB9441710.1 hypothetical protein [Mycolicibacterium sp.]MCV7080897.1 hypothetical protein [Mycolicibacterium insubricum]ORA67704.1 hypothetical protein BST26_15475 [Mycolicibacterium insubricum]BBZ67316.1 hypothetical protein MINS_27450 [Mycolicibacterium insubricum]
MRTTAHRCTAAAAGLAAVALIATGCSKSESHDHEHDASTSASSSVEAATQSVTASENPVPTEVKLTGERDVEVTLTGPIAAKYSAATEQEKEALGKPLTGDHNAGARESGLLFQQFEGGVITAKNDEPGTPAFITWGKIREAWNVQRDPDGTPSVNGENGSVGPLGAPTSDETTEGDLRTTTFEHGKITFNTTTEAVEVTVNGKVVPSGL